ncbi:hypothetical protein LJC49_00685 [Ruminococcaceae bacterium OttesenSCG-928-I18]|nr:hypothetical protein [Ruminococcaceae bacterium OttesenSCG-928-I18]
MAEILKISTPLVEKNPIPTARPQESGAPFNLSDVSRVVQTKDPTEILQQNTGNIPREETPKILADLLKDPSVTVSMMRNIYLLQEVINLLPANNISLTGEIEQMFEKLLIKPGDITAELMRQEENTTMFKGELFDMLRSLLSQAQGKPETAAAIGILLKGLNATISGRDTLNSVANNLQFLLDSLTGGGLTKTDLQQVDFRAMIQNGLDPKQLESLLNQSRLTDKLDILINLLRTPQATEHFTTLKDAILRVLPNIENSVLFSPQMERTLPLVVYNLSRYNENDDFLPDALRLLLSTIDGETDKNSLVQKLEDFLAKFNSPDGARMARAAEADSQVIDMLTKIIGKQAQSEDIKLISGDKLENIVHSMLSSPSNFTPLLHFILPVEFMDLKAFAEIWIDPNAEELYDSKNPAGDNTHMLMVFDVEGLGRFEVELYVQGKRIAMNLLCPPSYYDAFENIGPAIRQAVSGTDYRFETINIDRLDRTHSLMDVFTDLPYKRMGIDVKV